MREIKFRGKSIHTGKWTYGYLRKNDFDGTCWIEGKFGENEPVDPDTIGQYLGVKDIEEKEIYEHDIFQTSEYPLSKNDAYVGVIEYEVDRFWGVKKLKTDSDKRGISEGMADGMYDFLDQDILVIGNIHENKEMIKFPE